MLVSFNLNLTRNSSLRISLKDETHLKDFCLAELTAAAKKTPCKLLISIPRNEPPLAIHGVVQSDASVSAAVGLVLSLLHSALLSLASVRPLIKSKKHHCMPS